MGEKIEANRKLSNYRQKIKFRELGVKHSLSFFLHSVT